MKRILIIRLSAIGDVIMASGLLPALRAKWPQAHIAWLVEPAASALLRHNRHLDQLIIWPKAEWKTLWREHHFSVLWTRIKAFRQQLRAQRFDLVLDIQGLLKSGILALLSGAPQRVGLGSREGSRMLMTQVVAIADDPSMSSEYRQLAQMLELDPAAFKLDIAIGSQDYKAVTQILARHGVSSPYAVICPFTTRAQKHWFAERWQALVERLSAQYDWPVVMLGGPDDQSAAAHITVLRLHNLVGQTSLGEAAGLIQRASLVIGVDTGLTHLGIAVGVPTLALFGSTCPYLHTGTEHAQVLYQALDCSPCRRHPICGGRFDCMRAHTVCEVLTAAQQLKSATV